MENKITQVGSFLKLQYRYVQITKMKTFAVTYP